MSEENVETVRRAYAALAEEGVEAMLAFTDPKFEMTTPSSLATEPDTYRGHDGVRRWFDSFSDALEGVYLEGQEFRATGDQVFVVTMLRGRGRSTGIDVKQQAFLLWTLRDGLVVRGDVVCRARTGARSSRAFGVGAQREGPEDQRLERS
jgi:ketosteroid isomerase-like protein